MYLYEILASRRHALGAFNHLARRLSFETLYTYLVCSYIHYIGNEFYTFGGAPISRSSLLKSQS